MRSMELGRVGVERRRYAVEEIRFSLARLYRGFVSWTSMYGEVDGGEERERRERVDELLEVFSKSYLPRSMWLAGRPARRSKTSPRRAGSSEPCSARRWKRMATRRREPAWPAA